MAILFINFYNYIFVFFGYFLEGQNSNWYSDFVPLRRSEEIEEIKN